MRYVVAGVLTTRLIYILNFALHNWRKQNKLATIGSVLLAITACVLAYFVLFGNYEL